MRWQTGVRFADPVHEASEPSEELGYGMPEFSNLLRMEPNDLRYLYGLQDTPQRTLHLHLVK